MSKHAKYLDATETATACIGKGSGYEYIGTGKTRWKTAEAGWVPRHYLSKVVCGRVVGSRSFGRKGQRRMTIIRVRGKVYASDSIIRYDQYPARKSRATRPPGVRYRGGPAML